MKRRINGYAAACIILVVIVSFCGSGCKKKDKPLLEYGFRITTPSPIVVPVGAPFSVQLTAVEGTEPYQNWTVVFSSLPTGYTLDGATGVISGCEYVEGTYQFTVEVSDSSSPPETTTKNFAFEVKPAEWTVLIHLNGDNDLEYQAIRDLDDMEAADGSSSKANFIVQLDRHAGYDSSNGDWTTCKRFYVTGDSASGIIDSTELVDLGEVSMGAQDTLQDFLEWGIGRFKAKRYALVLMDHGMTWKALSEDKTGAGDFLLLPELSAALQGALTTCGLQKLDLLGFDSCLTGTIEAVAECKDVCRVLVASAELTPQSGWDYEALVSYLRATPTATARQLGSRIAEDWWAASQEADWKEASFVALDLTNTDQLLSQSYDIVDYVSTNATPECLNLGVARCYADIYQDVRVGPDTAVDVGDLLYVLRYVTKSPSLQSLLDTFSITLQGMVIQRYNAPYHQFAAGLSAFFPEDQATFQSWSASYATIQFTNSSHWDQMLTGYYDFESSYVSNIEFSSISVTGSTVTTTSPVTLNADVTGDGITYVWFYALKDLGATLQLWCLVPFHNWRQLPNGRKMENWSSKNAWTLSHEWSAQGLLLTDGVITAPAIHTLFADEYSVGGQYSSNGGTSWFSCYAIFSLDGELLRMLDISASSPYPFTPAPGDLFKPEQGYIDPATGGQSMDFGPEMDPTNLEFLILPVEPGAYQLYYEVEDPFDYVLGGLPVTVP